MLDEEDARKRRDDDENYLLEPNNKATDKWSEMGRHH